MTFPITQSEMLALESKFQSICDLEAKILTRKNIGSIATEMASTLPDFNIPAVFTKSIALEEVQEEKKGILKKISQAVQRIWDWLKEKAKALGEKYKKFTNKLKELHRYHFVITKNEIYKTLQAAVSQLGSESKYMNANVAIRILVGEKILKDFSHFNLENLPKIYEVMQKNRYLFFKVIDALRDGDLTDTDLLTKFENYRHELSALVSDPLQTKSNVDATIYFVDGYEFCNRLADEFKDGQIKALMEFSNSGKAPNTHDYSELNVAGKYMRFLYNVANCESTLIDIINRSTELAKCFLDVNFMARLIVEHVNKEH